MCARLPVHAHACVPSSPSTWELVHQNSSPVSAQCQMSAGVSSSSPSGYKQPLDSAPIATACVWAEVGGTPTDKSLALGSTKSHVWGQRCFFLKDVFFLYHPTIWLPLQTTYHCTFSNHVIFHGLISFSLSLSRALVGGSWKLFQSSESTRSFFHAL